jgi:hypothetical protein
MSARIGSTLERFTMSLFGWLFSKAAPAPATGPHSEHPTTTVPRPASGPASVDPLADLKQQRHERREHLYDVVRSVMLRSEVLASHYKFKVLSLDARGRQFLVMIDLLGDQVLKPEDWGPVEQLMAMTAAQRHDLQVKAVYWRLAPVQTGQAGAASAPSSQPTPTPAAAKPAAGVNAGRHGFEPIDQDEVLAFKNAISAASPAAPAPAEAGQLLKSGPRRPPPQPGYEDTQLMEPDDAASPLSRTQFGGLD